VHCCCVTILRWEPEATSAAVTVVKEKKAQPDAALPADAANDDREATTAAKQKESDGSADDAGSSDNKQEQEKEERREPAAPLPEIKMKAEEETKESSSSSAVAVEAVTSAQPARLSIAREITPRAAAPAPVPASAAAADEWPERPPPAPAASAASTSDAEFRNTVRSVLVLLLDRLTRTLEYEKAAFQELAVAVGHSNYMQLFDYAAFEAFLRANFSIAPSPSPQQQDTDLRFLSQYFSLFLTLASNATAEQTGSRVFPSRVEMTLELQRLCSETSSQLLQWCSSPAASVEAVEHLRFFSQAMQFAKGDLVHNPQLLQQNIDDICD
jgi:hypothetical protein